MQGIGDTDHIVFEQVLNDARIDIAGFGGVYGLSVTSDIELKGVVGSVYSPGAVFPEESDGIILSRGLVQHMVIRDIGADVGDFDLAGVGVLVDLIRVGAGNEASAIDVVQGIGDTDHIVFEQVLNDTGINIAGFGGVYGLSVTRDIKLKAAPHNC